jgi:ABC-type molybdate transport system substrate-binding protein
VKVTLKYGVAFVFSVAATAVGVSGGSEGAKAIKVPVDGAVAEAALEPFEFVATTVNVCPTFDGSPATVQLVAGSKTVQVFPLGLAVTV